MAVDTLGHLLALHVTTRPTSQTGVRSVRWPPRCKKSRATPSK